MQAATKEEYKTVIMVAVFLGIMLSIGFLPLMFIPKRLNAIYTLEEANQLFEDGIEIGKNGRVDYQKCWIEGYKAGIKHNAK